jgi:hypothetical protein
MTLRAHANRLANWLGVQPESDEWVTGTRTSAEATTPESPAPSRRREVRRIVVPAAAYNAELAELRAIIDELRAGLEDGTRVVTSST